MPAEGCLPFWQAPFGRLRKAVGMARRSAVPQAADLIFVDDLEVWVIRKNVKNVRVHVTSPDGCVEVTAPQHISTAKIEELIRSKRIWIIRNQEEIADSPMARAEYASKKEIEQWRIIVKALTPSLVEKWERIMGVKVGRLAYRNMRSRWGSCQPSTGRVCINVRLALYPPQWLEYVVVHELCHLLESGHGPRFKALMTQYLPGWEKTRNMLR